eukprot:m.601376 g.601376  ORF g.601376 m.601376 type:complete len:65 (-) comp58087_c0_seq9:2155-2349(-)
MRASVSGCWLILQRTSTSSSIRLLALEPFLHLEPIEPSTRFPSFLWANGEGGDDAVDCSNPPAV